MQTAMWDRVEAQTTSAFRRPTLRENANLARALPYRAVMGAGRWHSSKEYPAHRLHPWLLASLLLSLLFLHLLTFRPPRDAVLVTTGHTGSRSSLMFCVQPSMQGACANFLRMGSHLK